MVLFKRKPVQFLPTVDIEDDDAEVWHIPQTGEVFVNYEDYLARMDFYKQRRFNDQITGHSGLTFFEAFNSELTGGREVEATFPEALKGPILRKVQFQTVSRLDNLVDLIFDEFRHDYYPGEEVTVTLGGGDRILGLVRDKTTFGPRILSDGSRALPVTRYLVNIKDSDEETIVTDEHICRDRGVFTKAMLRSFIKKTVIREAWTGAPWLVKHDYANMYHIDTRVPPHLRYDMKLLERKQLQAQKRGNDHDLNGHTHTGPVRLPELKPATKSQKGKQSQPGFRGPKWPFGESADGVNGSGQQHEQQARQPTPSPPPPPTKYPIEDLALPPKEGSLRPRLKFMCRDPPVEKEGELVEFQAFQDKIDMATVGAFLETWDTLNVYCEIFQLDSFTFDDFVEAMTVASERTPVQLFDEIHCSVLKILVDSEKEGGKVRIALPDLEDEESDEEGEEDHNEEDAEEEDEETQTPEPERKPNGRATRSSLAKLEAERLAAEAAAAEEEEIRAEQESRTRAEEMMREFDWIDHLRKRDFGNGGWERIIVGLLHQLSKDNRYEETCEELLEQLVPADVEPTQEAVQQKYAALDVNHRVKALQTICLLTMQTKAVRGYMEDCSETMTKYRKDRIEWQRQKKQAMEEVRQLHEQRRELIPDPDPAEEVDSSALKEYDDTKMADANESPIDKEDGDAGAVREGHQAKGKRRGRPPSEKTKKNEAGAEKERKKETQKGQEKGKPQEPVKLTPQQQKQYKKILKEIQKKEEIIKECEDEVAIIENDLREADCPRTRVLGKDRFWNRYYWFERNGMPYGGLPTSSTASAEYANGCIWVQGPDDMEREGFIDGPQELQNEYKAKFRMTVSERKAKEEDGTSVFTAKQWGYLSEPEEVTALIKWLDPRGFNESKLRKELTNYRDRIVKHMENRKIYLSNGNDDDKKDEHMTKRSSSRIREETPEPSHYRCLQWENTMALEELGHLHSNPPPPPPRVRKQTKKREAQTEAAGRGSTKARRRG